MLLPAAIDLKFHIDSMKVLGILAVMALLGFVYSAYQFVRLNVRFR